MLTAAHTATCLAQVGFSIFPVVPGAKVPACANGVSDATSDPAVVAEWWADKPYNIGLSTNGLVVIDVDSPTGDKWLSDSVVKMQSLGAAPMAWTPNNGKHYFFRQPAGKAWRNTARKLADGVDTRANGGYVLVAPSWIFDNSDDESGYEFERGDLDGGPQSLPEPPQWLVDELDALDSPKTKATATTTDAGGNKIPAGQRNATLASLGGTMRRAGMAADEIRGALQICNVNRCEPPVSPTEVDRIADSVARYAPDQVSVAMVEHWHEQGGAPGIISFERLVEQYPTMRKPLIEGLLREGETMNIIAGPKSRKSWLIAGLSLSVATGRQWLGTFATRQGRVLIIDNELHHETLSDRMRRVGKGMGMTPSDIGGNIDLMPLRGRLQDLHRLVSTLKEREPDEYALVVLDAFYRAVPSGTDENDNGAVANMYNMIDAIADHMRCSWINVHHTSKGDQSQKSVTSVGAGAGSQSRAADAHVVMLPHEADNACVVDAAIRSWKPIKAFCLRWDTPLWHPAPDLDPADIKQPGRRRKPKADATDAQPEWTAERFAEEFLSELPQTSAAILAAAKDQDLSNRKASDLLKLACETGSADRLESGPRSPHTFIKKRSG